MQRVLLVAATERELTLATSALSAYKQGHMYIKHSFEIHQIITGPGIAKTCFHLTEHLAHKRYDMIFNIGICGAFDRMIPIGEVLRIDRDRFADWGVEENKVFKDAFEMGLDDENAYPFEHGWIYDKVPEFWLNRMKRKVVDGFTVNTIRVQNLNRYDTSLYAETESMEGAAFFYVCRQMNQPCAQIRSVSNYVGERDKSKWDTLKALRNLSQCLNDELLN